MTDYRDSNGKSVRPGDVCPCCAKGTVEIASSPRSKSGDHQLRYLHCSRHEEGCEFTGKQVVPAEWIRRRRLLLSKPEPMETSQLFVSFVV